MAKDLQIECKLRVCKSLLPQIAYINAMLAYNMLL